MANERVVNVRANTIDYRSPAMIQHLRAVALDMITARRALRATIPGEFLHCPSLDLLFELFVADRQAAPLARLAAAIPVAPPVTQRWVEVFAQRSLVMVRDGEVALTDAGFRMMAEACQAVIASQMSATGPRPN